ncbi:MAG TPA: HAMP domain-containing protein [Deltaproteobacteria bacterium]|nr:HAMP domain-containing protein [Deltaproteobacteria bacterium]
MRSIRTRIASYTAGLLVGSALLYGLLGLRVTSELRPVLSLQLKDSAAITRAALQELLAGQLQNVKTWASLGLTNSTRTEDQPELAHFLEQLTRNYAVYLDVLVLDGNDVCLASSWPEHRGLTYPGLGKRFLDAHQRPRPAVAWSEEHQTFYVGIASPLLGSKNGALLVAMLDRAALDTIVRPRRDSAPVELLLLNADLEILAGSNRALLGDSLPLWENQLIKGGKHEHDDEQIYSAVDPAGEELLVSRLPLQAYRALPRLDWTVVASLPEQLAFLPLTRARNYIVLLVLAAIVLGIAMAWALAESVARPIKELTLVTQRIAREGTLEAVPDPDSNDEVGELARSFQAMVENVTAAHDELVQSSKLAFLGELAAGIAHEIRTPLGIIKNSAQLLERRALKADDKEAQEFSRFIQGESDRLNLTVDELLNLARPTPLKKSPASINAIVERATGFLSTEARSRKVSLSADLAPSLPETRCDAGQLFQVLLNLTMNSLQVSTPGSSVLISTRRLGDELEIAVTDDGPGIPPDLLGALFTPFVSQREGGLGLGLAIVKRIVEAHGGKISGENLQTAGARFALTLPISTPGDSDEEIV